MNVERQEQKEYILALKQTNYGSYREIAKQANKVFEINYWDSERVRDIIRKDNRKQNNKKVNELIKSLDSDSVFYKLKVKRNKILVLADLHIPFQRNDTLDVVRKHKNEIKAIICPGDVLDCFEISKFLSLKQVPIEQELINAIEFFTEVRAIVGNEVDIILHMGNHDARWRKYIANMHQKKLYKFINPNVLEMIKSGFTLYEDDKEIKYQGVNDLIIVNSWYININDEVITCHPNNFSRVEITNAKNAINHFISAGENFKLIAVAHNHHQGYVPNFMGKIAFETGCMCQEFDYSDGNTKSKPQDYGYLLIAFDDNGKIDLNDTKLYNLPDNNIKKVDNQIKIIL